MPTHPKIPETGRTKMAAFDNLDTIIHGRLEKLKQEAEHLQLCGQNDIYKGKRYIKVVFASCR